MRELDTRLTRVEEEQRLTGDLNLNNIHNQSYVAVYHQADVKMRGVDGTASVFIKKGNLDLQISSVKSESRQ